MHEIHYLLALMHERRDRMSEDRGAMSAEMVIILGGLALLAIAVVAVVTAKVIAKANSLDLG